METIAPDTDDLMPVGDGFIRAGQNLTPNQVKDRIGAAYTKVKSVKEGDKQYLEIKTGIHHYVAKLNKFREMFVDDFRVFF